MFRLSVPFIIMLLALISCNSGENTSSANLETTRLEAFQSNPEEVLEPTRWDTGDTTITNEDRLDLLYDRVKDKKGIYIGVGSTQNFILASWADSEYIYLMDFTRVVVAANKIHIAFIRESPTPAAYLALWDKSAKARAAELITRNFSGDPEYKFIASAWGTARPYLERYYGLAQKLATKRNYRTWLNDQTYYDRIRNLAIAGRIRAIKGNLSGPVTVKGVGEAARKMNLPVRIVYTSNAEEYLRVYAASFRENWKSVPGDQDSILVRTVSVMQSRYPWSPDSDLSTDRGFHYNTQSLSDFQAWLDIPEASVVKIMESAEVDRPNGISQIPSDSAAMYLKSKAAKTKAK